MTDARFTKGHLITLLISSAIGVGFGAGWWFFGASSVADGSTPLVVVGIVAVLGLVGWLVLTARHGAGLPAGDGREESPFGKRYGIAVLLMLVGIFAGSRVLSAVFEVPEAVPAWVLFVVGLHFLPFAKLFGSRRFLVLSALLCAVAVLAAVLAIAGWAAAWQLVPGFGGAVVLWGTVAAGLLATEGQGATSPAS
ncbi:DUF7010 family protein [Amycolatopsis keratiniphila]|uniref:Uncharacterized protein n=1 Tax=Amycolatopsis keratiniphila subsp. keratiniphila TaxID=227715 RepID=A0A1W2LI00_9PSEU|nr:hypothetical protein [Amycolatopsis keratiniphila]ONF62384.1 hypothetical protein AVR91_0239200 [Amycolatopsis keratiniphila subsp. keratiniphila]